MVTASNTLTAGSAGLHTPVASVAIQIDGSDAVTAIVMSPSSLAASDARLPVTRDVEAAVVVVVSLGAGSVDWTVPPLPSHDAALSTSATAKRAPT